MMDSIKGSPLSNTDSLELALMILAWAKLSAAENLPVDLRFGPSVAVQPRLALAALIELGRMNNPKLRLLGEVTRITRNDPATLQPALDLALRLSAAGMLQKFSAADAIDAVQHFSPVEIGVPAEVASLLIQLANIQPSDTTYVAWDFDAQLALNAAEKAAMVYLETPVRAPIPALISLLAAKPFEVHYANPISSPSAVEDGKLRKFDVAISIPPFGLRYDPEVAQQDWFGRFPEQTTSGAILGVRQLLSQADRRVVVGVQNNLLFSTGAELALRKNLVERGVVVAVIAMPGGLLASTNIPFSVLVLDPKGGHDQIRFISAESPRFRKATSKAKSQLVQVDDLVEMATNDSVSDDAVTVSTVDVMANDAQLQVARYVLPEDQKRIQALVANTPTVALGDVVTTIRPMATTSGGDDVLEALEIGAANLPAVGYISQPGRTVMIERQVAEKNDQQFLRPLDIVLIVKGSVGKVGIVPENVPPPGIGGWVAGQSAIVLRSHPDRKMDPRALAMQLRSSFGQKILSGINSASTIPLIQLRELLRLQILIPDGETIQRAAAALNQEAQLQREIDRLYQQQSEVAKTLWPL